ncbi:B3 domain-containing protein [Platanthera guangdongensis]|uniref:B3 domain-containing protein n=1 Tax=Platanthera guangdongensis TaxID=2320717 RepID=A0ABR2N085_9ASPA
MRDGCWNCRKWEEHFYWDHFEESSFRFLKVMDGDFSQRMEFPLKFSKNFRVDLIKVVSLSAHSGQSWEIDLHKEQDRFFFKGGWKQFTEANNIQQYDTLIFQYMGDSSFMVQFFDKTGCVKVASNLVIDARAKKERVARTWETFQTSYSSKIWNHDNPMLHEVCDDRSTSRVGSSNICTQELNVLSSYSWSNVNSALVFSKSLINTVLHNFAGKRWKSSFVKLITKHNINGPPYLTIPKKFISDHIPQKPNAITICNKKKWLLSCRRMHSCWGFGGTSLLNFVNENNLREGDACVFNLKERNKNVVMEMHILQAKEVISILKNSCF